MSLAQGPKSLGFGACARAFHPKLAVASGNGW